MMSTCIHNLMMLIMSPMISISFYMHLLSICIISLTCISYMNQPHALFTFICIIYMPHLHSMHQHGFLIILDIKGDLVASVSTTHLNSRSDCSSTLAIGLPRHPWPGSARTLARPPERPPIRDPSILEFIPRHHDAPDPFSWFLEAYSACCGYLYQNRPFRQ